MAASSVCTLKAIHEYFREGKLPDVGTVCEIRDTMFEPDDDVQMQLLDEIELPWQERWISQIARDLKRRLRISRFV